MEKYQIDIDRDYQDPDVLVSDQRKKSRYDAALEEYTKSEKLRDEVVKKMFDIFRAFIHEDIRHVFDDILSSKLNITPWVTCMV